MVATFRGPLDGHDRRRRRVVKAGGPSTWKPRERSRVTAWTACSSGSPSPSATKSTRAVAAGHGNGWISIPIGAKAVKKAGRCGPK